VTGATAGRDPAGRLAVEGRDPVRDERAAGREAASLLEVEGLTTVLHLPGGAARVVRNVSFEVASGETLGIVGESGCGKTMLALSLIGMAPHPPAGVVAGAARFRGDDLLALPVRALREVRGRDIGMIFQEPMTALNPLMTVGEQIAEVARRHLDLSPRAARGHSIEMLERVRVPDPDRRARSYPHELSGGMRQRAMIAAALVCDPAILIADEPTTALDVTIQSQILSLIADLQERLGMGVILITHDLGVIAETADRVMVMYAGRKVEEAPVAELFADPRHPYTRGLVESVPIVGRGRDLPLAEIAGTVPEAGEEPAGCAFASRCGRVEERCRREAPRFAERRGGPGSRGRRGWRGTACHNPWGGTA